MKRRILATSLGLSLGWYAAAAPAQDLTLPREPTGPAVILGRPIPIDPSGQSSVDPRATGDGLVRPASYPVAELSAPSPIIRAQAVEGSAPTLAPSPPAAVPVVPTPVPVSPDERYNSGVLLDNPPANHPIMNGGKRVFGWIPSLCTDTCAGNGSHGWFQSDHCFDNFISPVTNPFRFEDPRSLTEVRPVFIWQETPKRNYVYQGGDVEFFGTQARLAITERFDLVMNKLGYIWSEPHNGGGDPAGEFAPHVGFAEIEIGPKYTFLRNDQCERVAAVGLTFDIPAGESKVFQDTGTLSLIPYVSFAQGFCPSSYGSFNFMTTVGYSFDVDSKRSDYFFSSFHLDFDVARLHKIYPLIELNWFNYTRAGKARELGFEGRDLFNFGSHGVSGDNDLTMAVGARYKFSECIQTGIAAEFPLVANDHLLHFRLTWDVIFRF